MACAAHERLTIGDVMSQVVAAHDPHIPLDRTITEVVLCTCNGPRSVVE